MRVSRDTAAIGILLLVFIGGGLLLGGRDETKSRLAGPELRPDPSVFNDRASGSRGCLEWTRALGYHPVVWRQNWQRLPQSGGQVLMVIAPRAGAAFSPLTGGEEDRAAVRRDPTVLQADDARALLQWLRAGHTAIVMASRLPTGHTAGETRAAGAGGSDTFADALDLSADTATEGGRTEFGPLQPVPETAGILSVHSASDARLRRHAPDAIALFGDNAGPLALSVPVGRGRLVAIADGRFASNAGLPRSENALFLAHVLAQGARPGATVLFDEYHHGDALLASDATLWTALGRPLQLAFIQGALALLVVMGALAVRFGTPRLLAEGQRRASVEYVDSLAGLYRRAQASPVALEAVYRQFLRDLTGSLALAPDVSLERLANVAARRGHGDKEALRRLLASCEQALDAGKVSEQDLLALTRQMETTRKDMGLA